MIRILKKTFPNAALATLGLTLEEALSDCESVLDVGCGDSSPLFFISPKQFTTGVDGYKPAIQISKRKGIHNEYFQMDVREIKKKFYPKKFDAVIALDVIEHLIKKEGVQLLKDMEALATKKVIILTPNGFLFQIDSKNNLQEHLSGWNVKDFSSKGYKVNGMYGWKPLRGSNANLHYRPKLLSGIISEASHYLYTRSHPESSFSLFAVKHIK